MNDDSYTRGNNNYSSLFLYNYPKYYLGVRAVAFASYHRNLYIIIFPWAVKVCKETTVVVIALSSRAMRDYYYYVVVESV